MQTRYNDDEKEDWETSGDAAVHEVIGINWTESAYRQARLTRIDRYIDLRLKRWQTSEEETWKRCVANDPSEDEDPNVSLGRARR